MGKFSLISLVVMVIALLRSAVVLSLKLDEAPRVVKALDAAGETDLAEKVNNAVEAENTRLQRVAEMKANQVVDPNYAQRKKENAKASRLRRKEKQQEIARKAAEYDRIAQSGGIHASPTGDEG